MTRINHYQGDTLLVSCPLLDENGDPLTGVDRVWMSARLSEDTVEYLWGPEEGVLNGTIASFEIPSALTKDEDSDQLYFDVRILMDSGRIHTMHMDIYNLLWTPTKVDDMS